VPFRDLIARVGVQPGVDQVYSYSLDSNYTASTPFQALTDGRDAMVVVGLNGEPLADERGYPARMLVPGLFGFVSATKWLRRIEFTSYSPVPRTGRSEGGRPTPRSSPRAASMCRGP
jgi:DMSO/TMAO reductase YedYZ molybdopterin-dependent catalytic subunit